MKKSGVFLLALSIILLLFSVIFAVGLIGRLHGIFLHNHNTNNVEHKIKIADSIFIIKVYLIDFLTFFIPGLFGVIGSIKRGRFTVVCIVIGGLLTLYMLASMPAAYILNGRNGFYNLNIGSQIATYAVEAIFFALYTAAAAVIFKFRKTA